MSILQVVLAIVITLTTTPLMTGSTSTSQRTLPQHMLQRPATHRQAQAAPALAHPRLFFNAQQRPGLRVNASSSHRAIWAPIEAYVTSSQDELPPTQAPDAGLSSYRNFGNRLITVAFACVVSEAPALCTLAKNHLLIYAGWQQWGEQGARDLGLAHMLLGNALAYDWLYDQLTADERTLIRQSLAEWAHKMDEASRGAKVNAWYNWWRNSYAQNHHWINHSALGMAALALLGEEERAPGWLEQASTQLANVQTILNNINDGSWHEGLHYQNYGLTLMLPFLINLRAITGADLLPATYLRNYIDWRLYNFVPGTWEPILGYGDYERDWGAAYAPANVLRFLAGEFQQGQAQWLADEFNKVSQRSANVWSTPWYVFEFLYYTPQVAPVPPTALPLARHFPDLAGVIWRSSWQPDALVFGLKSGPYGGRALFDGFTQQHAPWLPTCAACELNFGHNHDDSNTFYLARSGAWLAPETSGVEKTATAFHNTILIDGQGQARPPATYRDRQVLLGNESSIETVIDTSAFAYLRADATHRYPQFRDLQQVTRQVLFVRPTYFVVVDQLAAALPHRYSWIAHLGEAIKVEDNWVRGDAYGDQRLGIGIAAPFPWQITNGDDGHPFVQVEPQSAQTATRFVHLLWPTTDSHWAQRPNFTLFHQEASAFGLQIKHKELPPTQDDILITTTPTGALQTIGPYQYDGAVAVLHYGPDGALQQLAVAGATTLIDANRGHSLVSGLVPENAFSATFSGDQVAVQSGKQPTVTLYAPQGATLTFNGLPRPFIRQGDFMIFSGN